MSKIIVVDSIMGSGKSSYVIQAMNKSKKDKSFMYITPYLSETKRIKDNVKNKKFYEPNKKNSEGSKLQGLKNLIIKDRNISSTHVLFSMFDDAVYELLKSSNYTLIMDEVMNVLDIYPISIDDFTMLKSNGYIELTEDNKVIWLNNDYTGNFAKIKQLAKNNTLYLHTRMDGKKKKLFIWLFPTKIFECFKEIYILTYMFNGQIQKYYYDMFDIEYDYKSIRKINNTYTLVDYIDYKHEDRTRLEELISIYDGNLNFIGDKKTALSSTWLRKPTNKDLLKKLKNNTYNYYNNILKSKAKSNMWTTLLDTEDNKGRLKDKVKSALAGKGYKTGFVACTCRATNEYENKENLAYLINRFLNPFETAFFQDHNVTVDEERWALSEMLQWIWRSRIRKGLHINIYIPSLRMRNLLIQYLNNEI